MSTGLQIHATQEALISKASQSFWQPILVFRWSTILSSKLEAEAIINLLAESLASETHCVSFISLIFILISWSDENKLDTRSLWEFYCIGREHNLIIRKISSEIPLDPLELTRTLPRRNNLIGTKLKVLGKVWKLTYTKNCLRIALIFNITHSDIIMLVLDNARK